jgi:hypothetical protein
MSETKHDREQHKLRLIGQSRVVMARLETLEAELVRQPHGAGTSEVIEDAIGNLSFHMGGLIGVIAQYNEANHE